MVSMKQQYENKNENDGWKFSYGLDYEIYWALI